MHTTVQHILDPVDKCYVYVYMLKPRPGAFTEPGIALEEALNLPIPKIFYLLVLAKKYSNC